MVKPKELPCLPLQSKCMSLTILSVNSIYNFSELHLSYSLNFTADNYFSKVDLENITNKSSVMGLQ